MYPSIVSSIEHSVHIAFFSPTVHPHTHAHTQIAISTLSFLDTHKLINADIFFPLTHSPPVISVFGRYTHPFWTPLHGVDDQANDESSSMQIENQLPRSICWRFVCVCMCVESLISRPLAPGLSGGLLRHH